MYNSSNLTPIRSLLINLDKRIKAIKKSNIELDIKEQYMLQKLSMLINLLHAIDNGINDYMNSSQDNSDEYFLKSIILYANHLFVDFELTYDEFVKYYKTIQSIYSIIKNKK